MLINATRPAVSILPLCDRLAPQLEDVASAPNARSFPAVLPGMQNLVRRLARFFAQARQIS